MKAGIAAQGGCFRQKKTVMSFYIRDFWQLTASGCVQKSDGTPHNDKHHS